jgi:S1-C subfamily serine protease
VNGTLAGAIGRVRPAVVRIMRPGFADSGGAAGSGFFVHGSGVVATALHVIEGLRGTPKIAMAMPDAEGASFRAGWSATAATLVDVDQRHDLALLKTLQNPLEGPPMAGVRDASHSVELTCCVAELDVERPSDGAVVAVSGFPLDADRLVTTAGHVANAWASDTSDPPNPTVSDLFILDLSVNPGNSGGPVYRVEDGRVLGVCIQMQLAPTVAGTLNAGLAVARPAKYLVELMKRNGLV